MPVKLELLTKVVFSQPVVITDFMLVSKLQLFLFFCTTVIVLYNEKILVFILLFH